MVAAMVDEAVCSTVISSKYTHIEHFYTPEKPGGIRPAIRYAGYENKPVMADVKMSSNGAPHAIADRAPGPRAAPRGGNVRALRPGRPSPRGRPRLPPPALGCRPG